jgi:hypothetical protein
VSRIRQEQDKRYYPPFTVSTCSSCQCHTRQPQSPGRAKPELPGATSLPEDIYERSGDKLPRFKVSAILRGLTIFFYGLTLYQLSQLETVSFPRSPELVPCCFSCRRRFRLLSSGLPASPPSSSRRKTGLSRGLPPPGKPPAW